MRWITSSGVCLRPTDSEVTALLKERLNPTYLAVEDVSCELLQQIATISSRWIPHCIGVDGASNSMFAYMNTNTSDPNCVPTCESLANGIPKVVLYTASQVGVGLHLPFT